MGRQVADIHSLASEDGCHMERVARDNDRVKTKTHGSRERVAEGRILTMLRLPSNTATPLPTSVRTINNGQNTPPSQSGAPESKGGTGKQAASSSNVARNFVRAHLAQVWPLRHGHDNDIADARLLLLGQSRSSSKPPPRLLTRRFEFEPRPTPDRIIRQQRTRISNAETSNLTPTTAAQTDVSDSAPPEGNEKCVLELESSGRTGEDITSPQHEDADATPVVVDSNVSSSHVDACESHPHRTRPSVATQCHLLDTITGKDEGEDLASRIADKYPIWIDISRSHGAKFLEIADFSMPLALRSDPVPVEIIVEPRRSDAQSNQEADKFDTLSPPGNDEELLGLLRGQILTPHRPDDKESCAAAEYRARYREHFARESGKVGLGSSAATGIESLLTLQGDMSKLRQRLSELEMCANAIDDEFQMSYHRLGTCEMQRECDALSRQQVLAHVDQLLRDTDDKENHGAAGEFEPARVGVLTQKATGDFNDARQLLEQLEQLTSGGQDTEHCDRTSAE